MAEENPEITFPSIKFPILTDLRVNALALAKHYGVPPPETLQDVIALILTNVIVNLFSSNRIDHNPASDNDDNLDIKGACFAYIIGTALCRVLVEQGNEVDLMEVYQESGNAIFQECAEEKASMVLQEGQALAERFFEEALNNGEINEFALFVMSLGLLYSIEPKDDTLNSLVSLFDQIKDF